MTDELSTNSDAQEEVIVSPASSGELRERAPDGQDYHPSADAGECPETDPVAEAEMLETSSSAPLYRYHCLARHGGFENASVNLLAESHEHAKAKFLDLLLHEARQNPHRSKDEWLLKRGDHDIEICEVT